MNVISLPARVVAITGALAEVPHAFGGALALAYYAEPRATIDIDLNVFVPPTRYPEVAALLGALGMPADDPATAAAAVADGQVRILWDRTPVDLFLSYDPFHDAASNARRTVPFADVTIPVLAAEHLIVCKVVFNRAKDWVDIDALLDAGTAVDTAEVLRWVGRIAGDEDPRYERVATVLTHS